MRPDSRMTTRWEPAEYGADVRLERLSFNLARWVEGEPLALSELEGQLYGYGADRKSVV